MKKNTQIGTLQDWLASQEIEFSLAVPYFSSRLKDEGFVSLGHALAQRGLSSKFFIEFF